MLLLLFNMMNKDYIVDNLLIFKRVCVCITGFIEVLSTVA